MDSLDYHEQTKHTTESVRRGPGLDWANRPRLFKHYVDGPPARDIPAPLVPLLGLTGGVTKMLHGMPFRAAACTGALYHVEMYVVDANGVSHAAMDSLSLVPLRDGDFRGALGGAIAGDPGREAVVFTTTFWRNAWKYRDRMYRHAFWDLGTM